MTAPQRDADSMQRRFFRKHPIFSVILLIVISAVVYFKISRYESYLAQLPSQIKVSLIKSVLAEELFLLNGCEAKIFYLTDDTLQAIEQEKLAFFKDANLGTYLPLHTPLFYKPWQVTPAPIIEGGLPGLYCNNGKFNKWALKINNTAQQAGGYYTYDPGHLGLYILPSLKIVVIIWVK